MEILGAGLAQKRPGMSVERDRVAARDATRVEIVLYESAVVVGADDRDPVRRHWVVDRPALDQEEAAIEPLEGCSAVPVHDRRRARTECSLGEACLHLPAPDQKLQRLEQRRTPTRNVARS